MVDAVESTPGTDPDRAGFPVALQAARVRLIRAARILPEVPGDAAGGIAIAVLDALMPGRRPRTSARKVKCPICRYPVPGQPHDRASADQPKSHTPRQRDPHQSPPRRAFTTTGRHRQTNQGRPQKPSSPTTTDRATPPLARHRGGTRPRIRELPQHLRPARPLGEGRTPEEDRQRDLQTRPCLAPGTDRVTRPNPTDTAACFLDFATLLQPHARPALPLPPAPRTVRRTHRLPRRTRRSRLTAQGAATGEIRNACSAACRPRRRPLRYTSSVVVTLPARRRYSVMAAVSPCPSRAVLTQVLRGR
jgi:hypothetical protein